MKIAALPAKRFELFPGKAELGIRRGKLQRFGEMQSLNAGIWRLGYFPPYPWDDCFARCLFRE
ncbi:MAG: hypothetical protein IPM54_44195 [Polyangiaceae bacterium]|nr:hypothetical protein [Polyangiaceae bacterium]